jgi:tape measure domain-containing protein
MATRNTELQFRLTGDPASLLASLEKSRGAALRTYAAMREGVAGASQAWADAQAKVKGLAADLGAMGPPTKRQIADFQAAATSAGKLKDAYLAARDAATRQQQGLRDNASAISTTQQQIKAAADQQAATARSIAAKRAEAAEEQRLAAIVLATRAQMAAAAQAHLQAERRGFDEATAAAKRLADNQAAAAAWSRQYAAAQLASQDRINAFARRQVQEPATAATNPNLGATRAGLTSISQQLAQARNAALAVVSMQGVGDLVRVIDAYTSINARLRLATRSSQELSTAQRELYAIAQRNGAGLADISQFYLRISDSVRTLGMSQLESLKIAEAVSQTLRLSGASATESTSAMQQFSQALGKGLVNGDELTSILENAPRLARALADGLGVPTGKLKEMGEQGALSSAKVLGALRSQIPAITREAAQLPLTIGQSVTNVQSAFQRYVGGADEAAGSSRKVAGAINNLATNFNSLANGAMVAGAGLAAGRLASMATSSVAAAGGLRAALLAIPAVLASWPVAAALAVAGGTALWLGMGSGAKKAKSDVAGSLGGMVREVENFGGRLNAASRDAAIDGLTEGIKKAREQYAGLSAEAMQGELGKSLKADIARAEAAVEGLKRTRAEVANKNLTKERGDLGIDKAKTSDLALIDKDQADKLAAFEKLYKAFVRNSVTADGDLVTSYAEVRVALDNLIGSTKTPAEFDGLISRLSKALKGTPGGGTAPLRAELATLVENRARAEEKALGDQVAGLQARADRASKYFSVMAEQSRMAMEGSTNMSRITAELRDDIKAISADQVAQARSGAVAAQQSAAVQIAMLQKVADQKREIIEADKVSASRVATNARIDADRAAQAQLRSLAAEKATVAPDSARAREIATEEKQIATDLAKEKKRIAEASADAQGNAARRVADVERSTAQARLEILRASQQEIASRANDALAAYRNYAQQVIQLDRQIVANRLDTASSIEALKRKDMTPGQQADSLRAELERLKSEEGAAARNGDRTQQQELLNRQKSVSGELGGLSGDGVDQKAMRAEAIANLQRIGDESGIILQTQRAEAAAAAEEQKATYEAMVASIQRLSVEIGKINQGEAIKLKAEIDTASVQSAVDAVRQAFANTTFAVRVAATQSAVATGPLDGERRAAGGMMTGPGHDTSDNILTWTSPGEYVVKAAAVRHYGASTLAALNSMNLPRFAAGGLVGGLAIPSAIAERTTEALQPMTLAMPDGRRFDVQARPDVAQAMDRHIRMETLKYGRIK